MKEKIVIHINRKDVKARKEPKGMGRLGGVHKEKKGYGRKDRAGAKRSLKQFVRDDGCFLFRIESLSTKVSA